MENDNKNGNKIDNKNNKEKLKAGSIGFTAYGDTSIKIDKMFKLNNIHGFFKEMKKQVVKDINDEHVSQKQFFKMKLTQHNNDPANGDNKKTVDEFIKDKKINGEYNELIKEYNVFNTDVKGSNNYKEPFKKDWKQMTFMINGGRKKNTRKTKTKKQSKKNNRRKTKKTT